MATVADNRAKLEQEYPGTTDEMKQKLLDVESRLLTVITCDRVNMTMVNDMTNDVDWLLKLLSAHYKILHNNILLLQQVKPAVGTTEK
jgi:hypothetical protein